MRISRAHKIRGTVAVPGDKSIAHRALILGALARGAQRVRGVPGSGDLHSTADCLRALGCKVERLEDGEVVISSGNWNRGRILNAGNSGTTARLLAGLVAGLRLECEIDGDESLRQRPMDRIAEPLVRMGGDVRTSAGGCLPMKIRPASLSGITYRLPVASAQVKSAILIAGLRASASTTVIEGAPTRDHTERMLSAMGVDVEKHDGAITVRGGAELQGISTTVPGDVSSASFFMAAAAAHPDAEVRLPGVGVNPTRTGFLEVLRRMGADIALQNVTARAGEPSADITVNSGTLYGIDVGGESVPSLIDEFPVLAVVATQAEGVTIVRDAGELRHKESDRIGAIVRTLSALGADIEELEDGFRVEGPCRLRGGTVESYGDHRIAMAMGVAALVADGSTDIGGGQAAGVSYPDFFDDLQSLAH